MAHDEPVGRVAARPGVSSAPSGSWTRWPPPAATSSHDQFFSVVKKARPAPPLAGGISLLSKPPKPAPASSSIAGPKPKPGAPRPGPSKAPVSLLKAGPLRMGVAVPAVNVAKAGLPRPGPSSAAGLSPKTSMPRPSPPAGMVSKARHPSAGARPHAPSAGARPHAPSAGTRPHAAPGGAPRPVPDPFRPKPSASAPKPRMSWDLDLLTDGSPEDEGDFVSDLEQSPAFLRDDVERRPGGTPSLSILDRMKAMGTMPDRARGQFPKSKRGRPPKAPGEPKSKYVKKKQAANGASGHPEGVGILKPKWKGAPETLRNNLAKLKEKRRRRKEKLIAVRVDGSVPQVVTLLPKDPAEQSGPVPVVSPTKDGPQRPRVASPLRKPSGGSVNEPPQSRPETKPLFEHIDEDWAVIKKSLEKTETKKERKPSEASSSAKASSVTLTPSPTKKSDRSDELSTDDDIGNDLNAPLHNLEKLQDQMIQNLMDDGALAALKEKRKKQKEVQMFKKKKMSDYWKSKLGPGKLTLDMKMKRPYTMRPLTSDNVKHMEEAIAAVLAAPSPQASPEKRPYVVSGTGSPPKSKPSGDRTTDRVPPLVIRRSPVQAPSSQPPQSLYVTKSASQPTTPSTPQYPPRCAAMPVPRPTLPQSAAPQTPTSTAAGPATTAAAAAGLERRASTEPESDPAAAARLLQVKQELAARFLSDLHEQRAQLQVAEQQRLVWRQQQQQQRQRASATAAQQQHQQQPGWRPLIRIRQRRRRTGPPRIVRLTEESFQAGSSVTDVDLGDDGEDDGLAPVPVLDSPPPVSVSAHKVKEFLDSARVSRYRRTCGSGLLAAVGMPEETSDRMVFVSKRPLPPEAEQTLRPSGQGFSLPSLPGFLWPAEPMDPALMAVGRPGESPAPGPGWYGSPVTPAGAVAGWNGSGVSPVATAGWSGGVMSPAPGAVWQGQPVGEAVPGTALPATSITAPSVAPAPVTAPAATPTKVTTLTSTAVPTSVHSPVLRVAVPPGMSSAAPSAAPSAVASTGSSAVSPAAAAAAPSASPAVALMASPGARSSDTSLEEKPLRIALPATPSAEQADTPAVSTPRTPSSVSPRVAPAATPAAALTATSADLSGRSPGVTPVMGTSVPGTPSGVSPRAVSGASSGAPPSPRPVDPESLPFACNRCPAMLATLSEQVYHEIRMHMIEESLFRCLGCPMLVPLGGDLSPVLDGLLDHYMRHVDGTGRLLAFDSSGDFFRCEFCPRVFEDPVAYGTHEVQCRSLAHTCATCHGRFETADVLRWHEVDHLRAPDGKYCCDHCDSKFTKREQLLGHRRFHFKDKNVECPKCGKKFMTTGMLAMHNKWKHSQGPCRFCGRPFTSATARQAHEEHMHLKHMMHMCNVCHFRVMTATQLRVHKRTHSDDKPHCCPTCDEKFVSRNLLKKHKTSRHSEPRPAATGDGAAAAEPAPAPAEPPASQSAGESGRAADGTLTPAELRQLFERYKATWTGPKDEMTLSDLDTEEDEDEKRDLIDIQAKEELFKTKDKNTMSVWSCPVCNAFFTKLWGVRAHITLKHPGTSERPVLHDDKDTSAVSKQDFLKEIKRNAKTAKRELKLEAKRQARIAAYGDELPRRGRPRKFPLSSPIVRKPIDPSQPKKRGRPRKNPDDPTASPQLSTDDAPPAPPPPPKPEPKPEPPPDHVERRRWKCLTCEDQSQSYDDLVTHTYIAHPDADLPRFEVVITYVPKPVPKTPAEPSTPPPPTDEAKSEAQQDRDAAILDAARVRGAEKRRAPSATKVPVGAKRRSIPSATKEGATRGRGRGRGATSGGRGSSSGGRGSSRGDGGGGGRERAGGGGGGGGGGRGRAGGGDSYRKSYSNSSRRYKADEAPEPAAAADDADKLYCYCQSPYDEVSEMIGCDNDDCKHGEWFHFECVGIVIAPKGKWFCPDCSGKKSNK